MRKQAQTLTIITATALATAAAMLAVFSTAPVVAKGEAKPEIKWPTMKIDGCEVTLRAQKPSYKQGEKPVVELVAHNPTDAAVTLDLTVEMLSQDIKSTFSRRLTIPKPSWQRKCPLLVKAGERKTIALPTGVAAAKGAMVSFRLRAGKQVVATPSVTSPMALANTQVVPVKAANLSQVILPR